MIFKDTKSLKSKVLKSVEAKLEVEVKNYLIEKVNKRIKSDVYKSYSPQVYTRKYQLYDKRNHRHKIESDSIDSVALRYTHRAYVGLDKRNLSKLIILGQQGARSYGKDVAYYNDEYIASYIASGASDSTPFYKPRDFIGNAKKEIRKSDIVNILKKGL